MEWQLTKGENLRLVIQSPGSFRAKTKIIRKGTFAVAALAQLKALATFASRPTILTLFRPVSKNMNSPEFGIKFRTKPKTYLPRLSREKVSWAIGRTRGSGKDS